MSFSRQTDAYASVRSTASQSSGYVIVSQREVIRDRDFFEPPPDYDDEPKLQGVVDVRHVEKDASRGEVEQLLDKTVTSVETPTAGPKKTIVRINSVANDLQIEVITSPDVSSPGPTSLSPKSTVGDTSFLYAASDDESTRRKGLKKKGCLRTKRERGLVIALVILGAVFVITVVVLVFHFLVNKGD